MSTVQHRILDGKYRLVRQLVEGGMGSVWFAEHLSLHSPIAVKLIAKEIADTEEGLQRFLREARTAASIRSPHVVQILDYGVDLGTPYIVMELLDGESLAQRLERLGQLTPAEVERIIWQVSRAVGRAHDAGIVHRDLKPANIFIIDNDDEEVVKLLDFGIAKASADAFSTSIASNTRTGTFVGTPFYVSPEQAEGVKEIDHRSDIWSMGVIAYECLLGCVPFTGETFGSLVLSICSRPLPIPSKLGPVPAGFDAWFSTACARAPEERFPSARDAATELRTALEIGPLENAPIRRPPRRRPELDLARAAGASPHGASAEGAAAPASASLGSSASTPSVTTAVASSAAVTERTGSPGRTRALALAGVVAALVGVGVLLTRREPETTAPSSAAAAGASATSRASAASAEPAIAHVEPPPRAELPPVSAILAAPTLAPSSPLVAPLPQSSTQAPAAQLGASPRSRREARPKRDPGRVRRSDPVESPPPATARAAERSEVSAAPKAAPSSSASADPAPPTPAPTAPPPAARKRSVNLGF
jgi:eukaryotic-like serine/threonine-protein kinase